jgi:hypothetical protein
MRRYRAVAHSRALSGAPGLGRALLFSAILIITFTLRSVPSRASVFDLPADGSAVVGADTTITTHYQDTLLDIALHWDKLTSLPKSNTLRGIRPHQSARSTPKPAIHCRLSWA